MAGLFYRLYLVMVMVIFRRKIVGWEIHERETAEQADLLIKKACLAEGPDEIRKIIDTTNAIESINSVIRKALDQRKLFPHDDAAMKVIYLAIENASKKWSMSLRDWKPAINQFMIMFPDRIPH